MTQAFDLKLSKDRNLAEFLKVTVETTRQTLKCDRVIIYDASNLPEAVVIAESVAPQYATTLGTTIKDPFVAGDYLEMYCYGLPLIVDDLNAAEVYPDELTDLNKLKIKSLAIAPMTVENHLIALLVAHRCDQLQPWHPETLNILTEKANTATLALLNIANAEASPNAQSTQQPLETPPNSAPTMERRATSQVNGKLVLNTSSSIWQEEQNNLFSEVVANIAETQGQKAILDTTVREVRELLKCDRVVVYSLNAENYGVVIAESVAIGWTQALGRTIDDPCFAVRYIEKYRQGRVRAWNDVYGEDITPCYQEQLEALEVKAKVVAPIIQEGQLFGLLIAHQCADTRSWQELEINWITQIANQVGTMLDNIKNSALKAQQNPKQLPESEPQWNQHFTDAIQYIRQALNQEDILKASVKEVRRVLECDRVVIYSLNQDDRGTIVAESVAPGGKRILGRVINDPCFAAKYLDQYQNGRVRAWSNIYESGLTQCYIEQLEEIEVKANLVAPIINEGKIFGLLVAHQCSEFRQWQQPEIQWVSQIATQIGFALDNAKLLTNAKQLQAELENEVKLTGYFSDAIRYIRESLHREDILEISVEEVRRVLECDRVVVYSLNQELRYGTV
ncbi:MAG TPA: GAF domain-containing protein, partial [Xenococcaceae cyanobacterium]